MDKQTTLAFILISIILMVWLYMSTPSPDSVTPVTQDSTIVSKQEKDNLPVQEIEKQKEIPSVEIMKDSIFQISSLPEKIITVENEVLLVEMTTIGGRIKKIFLKEYDVWYSDDLETDDLYATQVQLLGQQNGGDFDIQFVSKNGKLINTANLPFEVDKNESKFVLEKDNSVKLAFTYKTSAEGTIIKEYEFFGNDYSFDCTVKFNGMNELISSQSYDLVLNNGINFTEYNSVDESNYSKASAYSGQELVLLDAGSVGEKVTKELNGKVDWIGVRNKYFGIIIALDKVSDDGGAFLEGNRKKVGLDGVKEIYSIGYKMPFNSGAVYQEDKIKIYAGPIEYNTLKTYNKSFESFVDFGSFFGLTFVIRPISEYILLPLFNFLHMFIPNYGFVIIVFSLIIKIDLYPLTKQSLKSMKKMQQLQPKIAELKEKYKDDQQRVSKETMKLYSTYGINPMGGCLPMLLQMPILIALYGLFSVAIELRHQPFIFWMDNLSSPDVILSLPFKIPLLGVQDISGLALAMGITMFIQQKMSVKDPSQKALVYIMPMMLTVLFMSFPSGLNLYYFMFNLFSIIQQYYVTSGKNDVELVPVKNPKQGGFMQRMMEAAEKNAETQRQATKKRKK